MELVLSPPLDPKVYMKSTPCCSPNKPNKRKQWKSSPQGWLHRKNNLLASSFFPSPLDRLRNGRKERALQLGLTPPPYREAFELNQSFPGTRKIRNASPDMGEMKKCTLLKFTGDSLNSYSFSPTCAKRSSRHPDLIRHSQSLSGSWAFYNFVNGGGQNGAVFPTTVQNPNKAVLTINAKTTEVLVMNNQACLLLGLTQSQLAGKKLSDYLSAKKYYSPLAETEMDLKGEIVPVSGKVMDVANSNGESTPVSVWMRSLTSEAEPRCIVVMEPVERAVGIFDFDQQGKFVYADKSFCSLHGYNDFEDIKDLCVRDLIPSLVLPSTDHKMPKLPKEIRKQNLTARTCEGISFPVSVRVEPLVDNSASYEGDEVICLAPHLTYRGSSWVFANLSGMITIFPDGTIHSCNDNFSLMLFGFTQAQLIGKNILSLIPSFYEDLDFLDTDSMPLPPLEDDDEDFLRPTNCDGRLTSNSTSTNPPSRPMNPIGKQIDLLMGGVHSLSLTSSKGNYFLRNSSASEPPTRSPSTDCLLGTSTMVLPSGSCHAQLNESSSDGGFGCFEDPSSDGRSSGDALLTPKAPSSSSSGADVNGNVPIAIKFDVLSREGSPASECIPGTSGLSVPPVERRDGTMSGSHSGGSTSSTVHSSRSSSNHLTEPTDSLPFERLSTPQRLENLIKSELESTPNELLTSDKLPKFLLNRFGSFESLHIIPEGSYFGIGLHRDGTDLAIIYQIRKLELDDGQTIYCLWVSRDSEEMKEIGKNNCSLTLASSISGSCLGVTPNKTQDDSIGSVGSDCSTITPSKDKDYSVGPYLDNYSNLQEIGKGAFGCVKVAYRNCDNLLVVTKFIRKSKVYEELWVFDSTLMKKVPLEVSLLSTLKHPNIVQVLDVYENDRYFQLVMEKHGSGMDLFEFIDRSPKLDEPLASHLFRQIVSGLDYLHNLQIVHRDIKDENIIINEKFHVKLIDFGSATFMAPDWLFSTFCGTTEYCSPEVLEGNKYRGPELEVWALGVTLYTLMYGENPFYDVEETIEAELLPPFPLSQSLTQLIAWLLQRDPIKRCTVPEAAQHPWTLQPVTIENYKFEDVVRCVPEEINPSKYHTGDIFKNSSLLLPEEDSSRSFTQKRAKSYSAELQSRAKSESGSWFEDRDIYS